jgi:hypothetical protein
MTELVNAVTSWWNLVWVLALFGVAPRLSLRLILRAYRRDDPRRAELIAELRAVPRCERPLWVAEQLEVALFDGLVPRVSAVIRVLVILLRTRRLGRRQWVTLKDGRRVQIQGRRKATRRERHEITLARRRNRPTR